MTVMLVVVQLHAMSKLWAQKMSQSASVRARASCVGTMCTSAGWGL